MRAFMMKQIVRRRLLKDHQMRLGLSLVELSIVLLLIGLLLTMLFGVITGVVDIISVMTPKLQTRSAAFLAMTNVRNCINQTFFNPNIKRLWFVGSRNKKGNSKGSQLTLSCVHSGAEKMGRPAVREVSYYLKPTDSDMPGTYTLMRREGLLVDDKPGQGGLHYQLVHNVKEFELKYTLNGKKWQKQWRSRSSDNRRIPRIVEIRIVVVLEREQPDKEDKQKIITLQTLARPGLYIR